MIQHHLRGPGSMITGRSVHNQRIKRLWRDVFTECTSYYYALFYILEDSGLLSHCKETDLFVLHLVFTEDIQQQLNQFEDCWNHHKMRTCHNRTPMQQWILGFQERYSSVPNDNAITGLQGNELNDYGIDWEGPVSTDRENTIIVPDFILEVQNPRIADAIHDQFQNCNDDIIFRYLLARDITNLLSN